MFIKDNRITFGTQITPRIWQDNSGYLVCHDCVLARTGSYDYLESEVIDGGDSSKIVKVYRTPEEVFSPEAIASFENKPFCNDHPEEDVAPLNYKDLCVGFVRDVRRGTGELENCLVGDVIVYDPEVAELIKSGKKRELSLGYNTDIVVDKDGRYVMTNIRGNHLALVDSGRAGCATIRDSADKINNKNNLGGAISPMKLGKSPLKVKFLDEDIYEVVENKDDDIAVEEVEDMHDDDIVVEEPTEEIVQPEEVKHDADDLMEIKEMLKKICEHLGLCEDAPVDEPVVDEDPIDVDKSVEEEITTDADDDVMTVEEIEDDDIEEELKPKAMDADKVLPEMDKPVAPKRDANTTKKVVNTYAQFAQVKDTNTVSIKEDITKSWQNRYNQAAKQ